LGLGRGEIWDFSGKSEKIREKRVKKDNIVLSINPSAKPETELLKLYFKA
jgi:hypothetical protein